MPLPQNYLNINQNKPQKLPPGERHAENHRGHSNGMLKPHCSPCFEHAYRHQLHRRRVTAG